MVGKYLFTVRDVDLGSANENKNKATASDQLLNHVTMYLRLNLMHGHRGIKPYIKIWL